MEGADCMKFFNYGEVPKDKNADCNRVVRSIRPQKAELHRAGINGGSRILDHGETTKALTEDLTTMKLILSSVISTPGEIHECRREIFPLKNRAKGETMHAIVRKCANVNARQSQGRKD